jgi:nitroimidazol reductase NimA-like FMN-containing flavoprotein (pyridoxamine 5'-phosphate oxidase superfamily)
MTTRAQLPTFASLTEDECRAFLARRHVGRVAFTSGDGVDIQPVNYVYDNGWIFGRTQMGSKLASLAHRPSCAFEVDEVRGMFEWDSVVAHGSFDMLDPQSGSSDVYDRALTRMRMLIPDALTAKDPTPGRLILFGIFVSTLSGRAAHT